MVLNQSDFDKAHVHICVMFTAIWLKLIFGFQNGVLAPNAKLRAKVVPKVTTGAQASAHTCEHAMHSLPVRMSRARMRRTYVANLTACARADTVGLMQKGGLELLYPTASADKGDSS